VKRINIGERGKVLEACEDLEDLTNDSEDESRRCTVTTSRSTSCPNF
jgi:hypothetical protein